MKKGQRADALPWEISVANPRSRASNR